MLPNLALLSIEADAEPTDARFKRAPRSKTPADAMFMLDRVIKQGGIKSYEVDAREVKFIQKGRQRTVRVSVSIFGLTRKGQQFYLRTPLHVEFTVNGLRGVGRTVVDDRFGGGALINPKSESVRDRASRKYRKKLITALDSYRPPSDGSSSFRPIREEVARSARLEAEDLLYTTFPKLKILRKEDLDAWRASGYEYVLKIEDILLFQDTSEMTLLPRRVKPT